MPGSSPTMSAPTRARPGVRSLGLGTLLVFTASSASAASSFPPMTDQQYELLYSVPSIIYGLALANLVSELGGMLRAPKHVPRSLSQIIWIFVSMLFILVMFFAGTKNAGTEQVAPLNHFGVFLSTIVLALLLFLASDFLVIPNEKRLSPDLNYREEFKVRARPFVAYTLLALFWLSARDSYLAYLGEGKLVDRVMHENILRLGVCSIMLIPLVVSKCWTHVPAGLFALAALGYHIYSTPGFLHP